VGAIDAPHRLALGAAWPEHYALDMHPSFQCTVGAQPGSFTIMGNPRQWILRDGKAYQLALDTRNANYTVVHWRDPGSAQYPVRYDRASGAWHYDGSADATADFTAAAAAGGPRAGLDRARKVHEVLGHLSLQDLLLQGKQQLASEWGLQLNERVRTRERLMRAAQIRLNDVMQRATQGALDQHASAGALRDDLRRRRLEARDARSEYRDFIRLQPALHLQRQRYEVWRLSREVAGVLPRTDTRVLGLVPRALALDAVPAAAAAAAARGVGAPAMARHGGAAQSTTMQATTTQSATAESTAMAPTTQPR
jgi:hypothetical protein